MRSKLTPLARKLRNNPTEAEKKLWYTLRAQQFHGLKFRRKQIIGNYVVDFFCAEKKLIIEVDGGQHTDNAVDQKRDDWLLSRGYRVLRFWNNEINKNMDGILEKIFESISLSPSPSLKGRGVLSFTDRVREVVRAIPRGQVRSYGEVAALAGSPRAARAVGTIMANNFDKTIPCHRVIAAGGKVGNYNRGDTPDHGRQLKIALLKKEGVRVEDGRVAI